MAFEVVWRVMAKPYDFRFRLLLIGDGDVGKTCILKRFTDGYFYSLFIQTIGKGHDEVAGCVHENATFNFVIYIFRY